MNYLYFYFHYIFNEILKISNYEYNGIRLFNLLKVPNFYFIFTVDVTLLFK